MKTAIQTTVLDAGGRYGIHPSWKSFTGELKYYLFEPDSTEAERLRKKYAHRSKEVKILKYALFDKNGKTRLFFFRNRAMSSSNKRNPISVSYIGERKSEEDIVGHQDVKTITVDSFCEKNNISLDFLKVDTEGSEYQVLQGAKTQLSNDVLGVRCEVSFDYIFKNAPLFSTIHDFLLKNGFYLLNLSYDGKGDYCNEFVKSNGKYGILTSSDGLWLKRRQWLFNMPNSDQRKLQARILKYALFCLNNHASDVAIDVLLQAIREYGLDFNKLKKTRLYRFADICVHKLFYNLKWQPGQSLEKNKKIYSEIFNKPMKQMHEYNQSIELNPD